MAALTGTRSASVFELLKASRWDEALKAVREDQQAGKPQSAELSLAAAIALIRSGSEAKGMALLTPEVMRLPEARIQLRRHVIPWLIQQRRLEQAADLADRLVAAHPDSIEDLRLGGSVHGRLKHWDKAIAFARRLVALKPDDLPGHTALLQLLLQSERIDEAGDHAHGLGDDVVDHPRLGAIALLALTRSGRTEAAAQIASSFDESLVEDGQLAGSIVRAFFEAGKPEDAVDAGERLLREGIDHPLLRSYLGQAYNASHLPGRYDRAIAHLREGLAVEPDDWRMNSAIGEALLRNRSYTDAIPHLERACARQPDNAQARALYARALKQEGRYDDAAREFRRLLKMQPSSPRWHRYAAGALSQAGHKKEAAKLFDAFVADRREQLPESFEQGLEQLWDRVDAVEIPKARLDWAWSLSHSRPNDREEWERRAKWGHLADHYLLDWLECREEQAHEAMMRLADLSEVERALAAVDRKKGVILASAHIGAMFAGPLALELLGVRSRWLASTPSVARTAYAGSLISTSDQDDMEVARAFMIALKKRFATVIAVDGAINLAAPRIPFEGQEITYSSFAARTGHRLEVPSIFCAPRWDGDRIGFVMKPLPEPKAREDVEDYAERWRLAYLAELRDFLGGDPENLRLSGGLWRHIR